MIRTGLRQKQQGSLSSVCLLCRYKSLLHHPGRRPYGWSPNRVPAAITGAPGFLALHATPSRASNQWGLGPSSGYQNANASGGGWGGGGGWGSGSGLKRDPQLEARKARDREEREAKERAVQEARLAKERAEQEARMAEEKARRAKEQAMRAEQQAIWARENQRYERTEPNFGARPPYGNDRRGNFRLSGNFTNRENPSSPSFDRFVGSGRADLPPRPARQQPAGSERLPWLSSQSRGEAPRDNENRTSGFWGQAEARVREQETGRESRPSWSTSRDSWSTSQDRWSTSRDSWSAPRNRPRDRLEFPDRGSGQDFDRTSWGRDSPYPSLQQSRTTRRDEDRPSNNGVRRILINPDSAQQSEARRGNEDGWSADPFRSIGRPDSQAQTVRSEGVWSEVLENKKIDPKPTSPAAQNTAADWDWADAHLEKAESRPRQSPDESAEGDPGEYVEARETSNELPARDGRREENRFARSDRSDRPERKEKRQGRPRPRQYENDEDGDVDLDSIKERRRRKAERKAEKERARLAALEAAGPVRILLPEFISVSNLAVALGVKPKIFINQMMEFGFEDVTSDSILTGETAAIIAEEYGFEPTVEEGEGRDLKPAPAPEDPSSLPSRPPVVTIMGHVDHGKTTLLDYLRKSSVAAGEHGGITQHIGAFSVKLSSGKPITFLDTPGHAAFTAMRQRGANVTDIAILVVAADDSVKPQTIEALKHARAAKVPIIVAITKVDKPGANVDKVKSDLAGQGVEIEDYGGDVQVVGVSGKTGQGMEDLEENILLLADILDIRAETDGMAEGWVLESSIKPYGRAATILVKRGTLHVGDWIVAGTVSARVRILRNEAGAEVDEAPPGTAIEVLGWKDPPNAGDQVLQAPSKDKADDAVAYRLEQRDREEAVVQMAEQEQQKRERERERLAAEAAEAAGEEIETPEEDGPKIVNFTVKGDVHGSVEAVCNAVQEIGNNEVRPKILMSSPGQITESDVDHAAVSGSCIINFNNPVSGHIKRLAINSKVRILDHNIIYHMAEEVKDVLSELLPPSISQKVVGEAEILQVFSINIKGRVYKNIAGCRIRNGQITRNSTVRVLRGDQELFTGPVETLKQGKKAVSEVKKGAECGVSFLEWEDFQQGDQIQVIEDVVTKRRLQ